MSAHWSILSLLLPCLLLVDHCQASYPVQLYRFIPVRLYTPEFLQDSAELRRPTRQQQIVQEVVVENNFGGGGFGIPSPPSLFGGLGRPDLGFGGRPGLIPGRGFGGSFSSGFGGSFGATPLFRAAVDTTASERSYGRDDGDVKQAAPAPAPAPAPALAPCSEPSPPSAASVPSPPCATSYVFSCQAVLKPVPCATAGCY